MGARIAKFKQVVRTPSSVIKSVETAMETKKVSPRHPSTVKAYEDLAQSNPKFERSAKEKSDALHEMLHSVRVDSTGAPPTDILKTTKKRFSPRGLNVITEGRVSTEKLAELFINRKVSSEEWTDETIAERYKLDLKVAQNLTKYFGSFYIYKRDKDELAIGDQKKFYEADEEPEKIG